MVENKSTIFGIIALIIGASGLGLGAFSVISLQAVEGEQGLPGDDGTDGVDGIDGTDSINGTDGIDGIDGTDAPGYYCNSAAEVQQALDSIGTGSGKIIITESITLNSKINISGGGSYVIQGQGAGTTINCSGDWNTFDITNATSCIIKDLKINSSNVGSSTAIININEINDNPIYIEKIQIIGDSDLWGYGIHIDSGNIWVSDCYISEVNRGIFQSSGASAHIYNNKIFDCGIHGMYLFGDYNYISGNSLETGTDYGITIYGSFNMIISNFIKNFQYGIRIFEDNNTIKDNSLQMLLNDGIYLLNCDSNLISGNRIFDLGATGIYLDASSLTIISENYITNFDAYGIFVYECHSNILSGNRIFNGRNHGILIYDGDYNVITGNLINNNSRTDTIPFAGIYLWNDANFNNFNGNGIFNCTNNANTGRGIWIDNGCKNNTMIGNTALNNDINWDDSGTDTFGDITNNNFG